MNGRIYPRGEFALAPVPRPAPVVTPARVGAGVAIIGGLVVLAAGINAYWGLGGSRASGREREDPSTWPPPDCSDVRTRGGNIRGFRYLERIRGRNVDPEQPLPMIILFHSMGSKPEHWAGTLGGTGPARLIIPQGKFETRSGNYVWFRGGASKNRDEARLARWRATADEMAAFIRDIVRCRPTIGLPVITGSSQGGHMTYMMANLYPGLVSGAVALHGWAPDEFWTPDMAPTVGLHGRKDRTVPYARTKKLADRMIAAGAPLEFHSFDTGHSTADGMGGKWAGSVKKFAAAERERFAPGVEIKKR